MSTHSLNYLTDMSKIEYPFRDKYLDGKLNRAFADIYLITDPTVGSVDADQEVKLTRFDWDGSTLRLVINLADGTQILDTMTADHTQTSSFGIWRVYEYVKGTTIFKVVLNATNLAELNPTSWTGLSVFLQPRNVEIRPQRVTSLRVYNQDTLSYDVVNSDIVFSAGYNMQLASADLEQFSRGSSVSFSLIAGAGLGKYPNDCEGVDPPIRSINGQVADILGNLLIDMHDCYWYVHPASDTLEMNGDCTVCFSCDEVESAYRRLMSIAAQAAAVRKRLCESIVVFNDYIDLLTQFVQELKETKLTFVIEQTDLRQFDFITRIQVGEKLHSITGLPMGVKSVVEAHTITVSGAAAVYVPYSGRRKLPMRISEVFNYTPGAGFTYNSVPSLLRKDTYAYWYWSMVFDLDDPEVGTTATVATVVTVTWDDDTTQAFNFSNGLTLAADPP